jgi:hypothetical protein
MHRLTNHLRHNLIAWIALFVALGGTGYAAVSLPRNSVGPAQLRNHSIDPVKLNPKTIGGSVRAWAIVSADGKVLAGSGRPTVVTNSVEPGFYGMRWGVVFPSTCATIANIDERSGPTETVTTPGGPQPVAAGYVSEVSSNTSLRPSKPRRLSGSGFVTFNQSGQPTALGFDVAVIC